MNRLTGILLIALSAASFGTLAIFGRYLYAAGMDIFTVLFLRFSLAAIFMAILLMLRRESLPRGRILWQLIGMGALGYVGQSFSYLTAIQFASAGLVALLLYLYPMFVFILSVIVLRERVTWIKIIAIVIALAGTALTVDPAGGELTGVLLAIGYVAWIDHTGPAEWWRIASEHRPEHTSPPFFSLDPTVRVTIAFVMFNNFFWTVCTHGSDQVVLQRYFSTASLKAARRSYLINLCVDIGMATLLAMAGCAERRSYTPPPATTPVLAQATPDAFSTAPYEAKWWREFDDPVLLQLQETALAANFDIRAAIARVEQARAVFDDVQRDRFPTATVNAAVDRREQAVPGFTDEPIRTSSYRVALDAYWEIDLF